MKSTIGSIDVNLTTLDLVAIQYQEAYDRNIRGAELDSLRNTAMDAPGAPANVTHDNLLAISGAALARIEAAKSKEMAILKRKGATIIEAIRREILRRPQFPLIGEVQAALAADYPMLPKVDREALGVMAYEDAQRPRGFIS